MFRHPAILLLLLGGSALGDGRTTTNAPGPPLLLGESYPLEYSIAFHEGLLHWMDSLAMLSGAGLTAGKTVPAHRAEFSRTFGRPTDADRMQLGRYRDVRLAWARGADAADRDRLTLAFFSAGDLDEALRRASELLEPAAASDLARAMRHFEPRFRKIWRDGKVARGFVDRSLDSSRRDELASFLVGIARFYDVSPLGQPRPRLVLAPVRPGAGTHAQAVGPYLLIELRPGERLEDEVAPIVHENAHLLFDRMPPASREALARAARDVGPQGQRAWETLHEALPTAIAQGVADRRFRARKWSIEREWYDAPDVDRYAKRIYPLLRQALEGGDRLDETLVRRLIEAYDVVVPRAPAAVDRPSIPVPFSSRNRSVRLMTLPVFTAR